MSSSKVQDQRTVLHLDLGSGMFDSPSSSESSSPDSYHSQRSESEDSWEEDIADVKLVSQDFVMTMGPVHSDASASDPDIDASLRQASSQCTSARSSPAMELPPHMDLPTLFKTEDVRTNDSFLSMEDDNCENLASVEKDTVSDREGGDKLDLADALARRQSSLSPFKYEEDEEYHDYGERDYDAIEQDRRIYLGDDWVRLFAAIKAGVPLRRTEDEAKSGKAYMGTSNEHQLLSH
ncbi:hypothetical protein V5O48_002793 [Marasmius crinis-equi]|uniref:Uncharacterized protein n=1 Tax=Marasmius crinis-equi TaxID=585013 RepID=A0ABR3FVT3_9AGAR